MDNKLIIGIVIGAIALAAVAIFATQPAGQAMWKFQSAVQQSNAPSPSEIRVTTAVSGVCGHYCQSNTYSKCAGASRFSFNCKGVGCVGTCWEYWSNGGNLDTYINNGNYHGLCVQQNADVCVGATGKPTDGLKPNQIT